MRLSTVGITVILTCGTATADDHYVDATLTHLPTNTIRACMDVASGDVDADGDTDLVLAIEFERNELFINDGSGRFTSSFVSDAALDSEDVALSDLDGDGDLDLVFVTEDDLTNELYLNDGAGRYSDRSAWIPVGGMSNAVEVLDLNGDAAPDLLIGNFGRDYALINDGSARFTDAGTEVWDSVSDTQDLELIDVDGDGDLDVAAANEEQNRLFLNEGGRFRDATASRFPERLDESREMKAVDFDGDGDRDLVVTNVALHTDWPRRDYLLLNDGTGAFTDAPAERLPAGDRDHYTVQVLDIDTDGYTDILLPSSIGRVEGETFRVLLNDGRAFFRIAARGTILPDTVHGTGIGFDVEVVDVNGDGLDDLFLCTRGLPEYMYDGPVTDGESRLLLRRAASGATWSE